MDHTFCTQSRLFCAVLFSHLLFYNDMNAGSWCNAFNWFQIICTLIIGNFSFEKEIIRIQYGLKCDHNCKQESSDFILIHSKTMTQSKRKFLFAFDSMHLPIFRNKSYQFLGVHCTVKMNNKIRPVDNLKNRNKKRWLNDENAVINLFITATFVILYVYAYAQTICVKLFTFFWTAYLGYNPLNRSRKWLKIFKQCNCTFKTIRFEEMRTWLTLRNGLRFLCILWSKWIYDNQMWMLSLIIYTLCLLRFIY